MKHEQEYINKIIKNQLISHCDKSYQNFSSKLLPGINNILGIRLPILRKIAKQISNQDWKSYLENACDDYFEETMLQGLVIGYINTDIFQLLPYIASFIAKINNWSICDSFCFNLKITQKSPDIIYQFINKYFYSENEFHTRFSVVMLLRWFNKKELINQNLKILDSIKTDKYYAQMAIAWALAEFFITDQNIVLNYLQNSNLDKFTYNKSIQKIKESKKVSDEIKDIINDRLSSQAQHN